MPKSAISAAAPQPCPLAPALAWSGYLRRLTGARPELADWLREAVDQPVTGGAILAWHDELAEAEGAPRAGGDAADAAPLSVAQARIVLRRLRERVFACLLARDTAGLAGLEEVVGAMSLLADHAVAAAYRSVAAELAAVHGAPRDPATGLPQEMLIVGMGKLGGCELNVSSDIDLVMLYGEEGETEGPRRISHHEFYCRLTSRMMPVLSEPDGHGQVFRTDLRLRPDGDSGPPAWSLDALEHYLVAQGREWERYAWLKARALPARAFAGSDPSAQLRQLESLRVPFVYRKYFDFDALAALRALRERIRQDWQRRALARSGVDSEHNIKLGDGGIREIEFVVQLSQLIRGGRMPALQVRGLLPALRLERDAGLLPAADAGRLEEAYRFLRRTEHMLQYREDEQTHLLPQEPGVRAGLARAMGMEPEDFERTLREHRAFVHDVFRNAFRLAGMGEDDAGARNGGEASGRSNGNGGDGGNGGSNGRGGNGGNGGNGGHGGNGRHDAAPCGEDAAAHLAALIQDSYGEQAEPIARRAESLLASHRIRSLPEASRRRLDTLLPAAVQAASRTAAPQEAAVRLFDLIEQIAQRSAYLALLAEYPDTLARVARMMAASPWAAQYLTQHPLLLDGLIDWRTLFEPLDLAQVATQLTRDLDACRLPDGQPDIERQMNLMRDVQRQVSFQLLAQDLEGRLTVEGLADQLSALADLLLEETIRRVWPLVQRRGAAGARAGGAVAPASAGAAALPAGTGAGTGASGAADAAREPTPPRFAVIAYGKLGGKELGYASDLDLVFLFDDDREDAGEIYAKLGQRMTSWLSTMTSSGRLYEVDLRLRPDGNAGLLAVSVEAFAKYQREHAWQWEHQALTRARYAAGDAAVGRQFEDIRRAVLLTPRDAQALAREVRDMREKIRAGHPNASGDFDLKHDPGGMVDVEFVTQYLVLSQAPSHPQLAGNLGNIKLLGMFAEAGIIDTDLARRAADAYRTLRREQHRLRLQGAEMARVPAGALQPERTAVKALWEAVLGSA